MRLFLIVLSVLFLREPAPVAPGIPVERQPAPQATVTTSPPVPQSEPLIIDLRPTTTKVCGK